MAPAETPGCDTVVNIVRNSLQSEASQTCDGPDARACAASRAAVQELARYIDSERRQGASDCDLLTEVNQRLQALPPRHPAEPQAVDASDPEAR